MATQPLTTATVAATTVNPIEKRHRSVFDVPANFFDSCRLLSATTTLLQEEISASDNSAAKNLNRTCVTEEKTSNNGLSLPRWTCNTCKAVFDSLQDQRSHFKSDIHRLNVKLTIAGKDIVKEEDFDELTSDSFKDYDVSSISGSEDEADTGSHPCNDARRGLVGNAKKKLFLCLQTGDRVSVWKSLLLDESEGVLYENEKAVSVNGNGGLRENELIERLKSVIHETRDNKQLRVVLLASGGHFAGCVYDGNLIVAHKTFHRYVVRAKHGKKQSLKDGSGKSLHSAGASLRRHNELALKKEIQELLAGWKPYFDNSSCVFIHAPSNNRQLIFNGEKPRFSNQLCSIRNVPFTVRRPTFKEVQRIYNQLTQIAYETEEMESLPGPKENIMSASSTVNDGNKGSSLEDIVNKNSKSQIGSLSIERKSEEQVSEESESGEIHGVSTPLHEAAKSRNMQEVMKLLEQGLDPCIKDERGRTPYMLASEKEVRNTFRRFMALNPDKWDWDAAKVPSALTKEMEESQAAKQAEKDAKKKAKAKELKKLRRAREKAKAQASLSHDAVTGGKSQLTGGSQLSEEEKLKAAQVAEREKRAAAAERRIAAAAALNAQGSGTTIKPSTSQPKSGLAADINCSCCNVSLAGKVPFHRYNYKYCSASCMHVHREILEYG
ncbi:ankyrin repeat and zinc finger domain-containing protein 1 [Carica papaya]|uniref:ankyrin repeat and zinc finger domain-containing protein 1 n=1 Tax=Carica papaya TaxID=3649 RepID=UPI000B8D0D11|nr:ankyrin repeat and zinc finger domain-containing protein 1 [Carica papaya]